MKRSEGWPGIRLAMDADTVGALSARTRSRTFPRYLSCMRFLPQQKTRSRRSEAGARQADTDAAHPPLAASGVAAALLRLTARCSSFRQALQAGIPPEYRVEQLAWLGAASFRGFPDMSRPNCCATPLHVISGVLAASGAWVFPRGGGWHILFRRPAAAAADAGGQVRAAENGGCPISSAGDCGRLRDGPAQLNPWYPAFRCCRSLKRGA